MLIYLLYLLIYLLYLYVLCHYTVNDTQLIHPCDLFQQSQQQVQSGEGKVSHVPGVGEREASQHEGESSGAQIIACKFM